MKYNEETGKLLSILLVLCVMLFVLGLSENFSETVKGGEKKMYRALTDEEKRVIINKGTELPFKGKYTDHFAKGYYTCRQCGERLYTSESKFKSHCGWPSFDDEIKGAVKRIPDADGRRTEIVCANCDGHLGHVFEGEGYTEKNVRHCVNSISMDFVPAVENRKAVFAGGCFWGVEYQFSKKEGVISVVSGYTGGHKENPTYREVCSGTTGHAEAVEITYDPSKISFRELAKLFFEIHDPGQIDRQGPDVGEQYRSEIFYVDEEEKKIAQELIEILMKKGYEVNTGLTKLEKFYPSEDYHQDYYDKKGGTPYCHSYTKRF